MEIYFKEIQKEEARVDLLLLADPSKEAIEGYIRKGIILGAFIEDKLIGQSVICNIKPQTYEIMNIAVDENYEGRGVGKSLIKKSIDAIKNLGGKTLEIGTGNSSIKQLALYQKCGFRITGTERDFFIKNYEEEIFENGIQCMDMIRLSMDL
ncbi:GNAT family N-acetyltransferase [Clostridium sp.]|uniref:GNAT family N-acetyltransferase n=1 Tax=Clostridium sp. TaxID=1506 RepID=UPI003463AC6D